MNKLSITIARSVFAFSLMLTLISGVFTFNSERSAEAAFNEVINYQGKLTDTSNVAVADGTYNMEFKLYDAVSGGSLLWTETRTGGNKVQVTNGIFSVMLGDVTAFGGSFDWNKTLFLTANIGGTGTPSWDGEMTPRKKIGTVPAAFLASNLRGTGTIDITNTGTQATFNYDGSNNATLAVGSNGFTTLTSTGSGAGWNLTGGNVGIGTSSLSAKLHVTSTTEQLRTSYDAGNYTSFTTSSGGDLTIAPSGSDLGVTGNVDVSGTLTAGTGDAFVVNASGQVTAGTWQGGVVGATYGGTGVNNGSNTITLGGNINTAGSFTTSGANALTLTTTGTTNVTLPTSGTLITSGVTSLSSLTTIGTITSGTWNATAIGAQYGGTGINTSSSTGVPSISSGTWSVNAQLPVSLGGTGTANGSITGTGALSFTAGSTAQNVNLIPTTTGSVVVSSTTANTDTIQLKPQTTGTGATFAGIITTADLTGADKTYTFPNANITVNAAADISGSTLASGVTVSSLTTVGTLTGGATGAGFTVALGSSTVTGLLTGTNGGTGVNNGSNTITLGGNINTAAAFTTSGANALTLTTTGVTNVTLPTSGTLVNTGVTTLSSLASIGTITTGTWNGTAITDTYIADTLTVDSSSSVHWNALNNYPAACSAGSAISQLADTTNTCTAFNTDTSITLQDAYNATSGNTITTTTGRDLTVVLAEVATPTSFTVENQDTAATNIQRIFNSIASGTATNGLLIEQTGAGTLTNGIQIAETSGTITDGILITGTLGNILNSGSIDITGAGAITGATGVTSSGTITFSGLGGGGTQCVNVNNSGVLGTTTCGGALTPWTSDIDADGFDLNDLSNILFRETTGGPTNTDVALYRDNSGDLTANVLSAKTFNIAVNATDEYNFSSSGLAFNSNNITGLGTNLTATAGLTITSTSANLALATSTSGDITATTATTGGLFNVLTGSLKVGAGTPGLTLNGDDAYITGTFEVDGTTQFDGGLTFNSTAAFNGVATFNTDVDFTFAGTENIAITNTTGSNALDLFALTITNNDGGSATQRGLVLTNANSTSTTESLIFLDNADTTASSLTDGILITSSGVNDGITDAIDVSASNITNALNVGANTITGAGYLVTSTASGLTVNSTSANLALTTTTSGNITFAPASTGSVQITSGVTSGTTTSAGLSIAANSLNTGTGVYVASSTLSSGTLVDLQVSGTAGASSQKVINVATTGTITGTQTTYGGFFSNTHSGGTSTNIALYATASSGTNNYAAIFDAGSVGVGTTGPDRKLDVLDASNPQLRLTTTDGSVYSDLQNTSNANLVINGSNLASSSASQFGLQIAPTVAQTSSANYRALDINVTETSTTTLTDLNRLADFRVGSSSKLAISNNGSLTLQNAANLVTPYGGIGDFQNHLVRSEEFDNASWVKTSVTSPTANTQTAPDGSTSAESLATSGSGGDVCQWSGTAAGSGTFTFSVWARSTTGTQNFDLRVDAGATSCATANNVTGTAATHTATTSWQRFTVTQTFSSATGNVKARIFPGTTGSTGTIYAWAAQLDQASRPSNYVMTTSGALTNTNRGQVIESNFATASGFTYGGRHVATLTGSIAASSTTVGQLIRVIDNASGTDDTATVRALEVQGYSGTNINGINTAVAAFGYTFGVHAATTGQANESAQPAAVFADLDNGSATTSGNAIRAYTDNATSADLVSFYQESSTYTGNGLVMNFGNNSGSFTGNFISLKKGGTESFHVDDDGSTFVSFTGTTATHAVCHASAGNANNEELVDCDPSAGADFAEIYPVEPGIEVGEIVATGSHMVNTYDADQNDKVNWSDVKGQITQLIKSHRSYQTNLVGIVSDNYNNFSSTGYNIKQQDNPKSVALKGRVLVKVTNENGPIKAGDFITASDMLDGYGTKATRSGQVVGQALADIDFENNNTDQVMVFVQVGYQSIGNTIVLDAPSTNGIGLQNGSSSPLTDTASTFVIQQQTSGEQESEANILQLQTGDANRFMVSSSGATSILSNLNCAVDADSCPSVLRVTQADTELMNIDARGTLTLAGTIIIKDDTFAGSIVTDEDGLAEITFSYHLGTGKPVVQLTPEAQLPVFAQIVEFKQDENGNYTGFVIKTFDLISSPVEAIVHYNVVGKQAGYITLGEVTVLDEDLPFYNGDEESDNGVGMIIDDGEVVNPPGDQTEDGESDDGGAVAGDFTGDNSTDNISGEDGSGTNTGSETNQ